jgi:hypothetical protein
MRQGFNTSILSATVDTTTNKELGFDRFAGIAQRRPDNMTRPGSLQSNLASGG